LLARLTKFFFLPSVTVLVLNAVVFAFIFVLVIVFDYFPSNLTDATKPLFWTDTSLRITVLILLGGLITTAASIYGKTLKHFLCARQCFTASVGTTILVTMLYAGIWGLIQIAKGNQQLVIFQPQLWSLQGTLNDLKYATLLFLVSSISLVGTLAIVPQPGYDFTPFLNHWKNWKGSIEKLSKGTPLKDKEEHALLVDSVAGMLKALNTMAGAYVQPASRNSANRLQVHLRKFDEWYQRKTHYSLGDLTGLDDSIQLEVQQIKRLC